MLLEPPSSQQMLRGFSGWLFLPERSAAPEQVTQRGCGNASLEDAAGRTKG